MKKLAWHCILLCFLCSYHAAAQQRESSSKWPELSGPYLGQTPPGNTPEVFAPGLISTNNFELNSVFSPDGKMFMFTRQVNRVYKMFFSVKSANGYWTEPQLASLSKTYPGHRDVDMVFSPDQQWLYFISDRPLKGYSLERYNIWRSYIGKHGFETPEPLVTAINGAAHELYPMIVADGSLYFSAPREDSLGAYDSYRAQLSDGHFAAPQNLGPSINSENSEGDIYVSPDESLLIHVSSNRKEGYGKGDLYISFKQADGTWSKSKNMGPTFNSEHTDYCPMMTPDGKFFFFSRNGDLMWVKASAVKDLKPHK